MSTLGMAITGILSVALLATVLVNGVNASKVIGSTGSAFSSALGTAEKG